MCLIPVASIDRAALNIRTFIDQTKITKDGSHQDSAVRVPELLRDVEWHGQPVSGVHTLDGVQGGLVICAARGWTWCDIIVFIFELSSPSPKNQVTKSPQSGPTQVPISSKTQLLPRNLLTIRKIRNRKDQTPNIQVYREHENVFFSHSIRPDRPPV